MARDVSVRPYTITELVAAVARGEFLIPTFQRDVIWRQDQIASLWDSMYRSFPIGSLIYWQTSERLELIRDVGGFLTSDERLAAHTGEYNYILDGQQRLTAMVAALTDRPGSIEREAESNYALYFDATADLNDLAPSDTDDTDSEDPAVTPATDDRDDDSEIGNDDDIDDDGERDGGAAGQELLPEKSRFFLFRKAANRRRLALSRAGLPQELVVRIADSAEQRAARIVRLEKQPRIPAVVIERLRRLDTLLDSYVVPVERVRGVDRAEVCDIFMRINTAGRRADATDVVIATMFGGRDSAFDLRAMFASIREEAGLQAPGWRQIKSLTLMQMVGVCMREARARDGARDAASFGLSSRQLLNLTPDLLKPYWGQVRAAISGTIALLVSEGIYHPNLLPSAYLPMPLAAHLLHTRPPQPWERELIAQWVWRAAFDPSVIATDRSVIIAGSEFFAPLRAGQRPPMGQLTIRKSTLMVNAQVKSSIFKATLAFLSRLGPRDFDGGAFVTFNPGAPQAPVYGAPSIHHIYPKAFLLAQSASSKNRHRNALMNMCLISEATNQAIGKRSPAEYFPTYANEPEYPAILRSHLIPERFAARERFEKGDFPLFLEARTAWFVETLRDRLPDVKVKMA